MPSHTLVELLKGSLELPDLTNKEALLLAVFLLVLYGCFSAWKTYDVRRKMPPGPMGAPFIGNKNQIPSTKPWWTFEKLNQTYGAFLPATRELPKNTTSI
jgi:hypothetical protein